MAKRLPLRDVDLRSYKPQAKPYKKSDTHGLYAEVMPTGAILWRYKYRFVGPDGKRREKRLSFGDWKKGVTLAEARRLRDAARAQIKAGIDPGAAKKAQKAQDAASFEAVARQWHALQKDKWSPKYGAEILHRLEKDIFPAIGPAPIGTIRPREILAALRAIESRGARDLAGRALQVCGQIFRYAVIMELAESDPTRDLRGALAPRKGGHYPALEPDDLPELLATLGRNEARLYPQTTRAIRFMLLTFQRTSELIQATWGEIDWDARAWRIPEARMKVKGRGAHIVPLSTQALEILKTQWTDTAGLSGGVESVEGVGPWDAKGFSPTPSARAGVDGVEAWKGAYIWPSLVRLGGHMSNNTIGKALERMGYKGRMTGHGFRALAMSAIKEKLGYRHEIPDRQLAHAPRNKIDAAYDRAKFLDERAKMMQAWGDWVEKVAREERCDG
jgi:integrase